MDPNTLNLLKGAAGAAGGDPVYVEDVFSSDLWKGNYDTTQAPIHINNGIDLSPSGEGGLVWTKSRTINANHHQLYDTERGAGLPLYSSLANSAGSNTVFDSFNSNGFSLTAGTGGTDALNGDSNCEYVSLTFRKAPGFFDVVTWNGNNGSSKTISHNLGCIPGLIIAKNTSATGYSWAVYAKHGQSGTYNARLLLNSSDGRDNLTTTDWSTDPADFTKDSFTVGSGDLTNMDGESHVAYLFADGADADAQIFGDDGDESIIKCGSFTVPGTGVYDVNLGWEPQYVLMKRVSAQGWITDDWYMHDTMRGFDNDGLYRLMPNTNAVETNYSGGSWAGTLMPYARGFKSTSSALNNGDYIYVAIRRGPMKTPEVGTEVFAVESIAQPSSGITKFTTNFPVDMSWANVPSQSIIGWTQDRLRGYPKYGTASTQGNYPIVRTFDNLTEASLQPNNPYFLDADNTSMTYGNGLNGGANVSFAFRRAPEFFDMIAYTGTGNGQAPGHNLGKTPEFVIIKNRSTQAQWICWHKDLAGVYSNDPYLFLDEDTKENPFGGQWIGAFGLTDFFLGSQADTKYYNTLNDKYIAYLFASCSGVSKVGKYTSDGNAQNITCEGFTSGARFILIKRIDAAGNWGVWDSARGISPTGDDPYLRLDLANTPMVFNDISPLNTGFTVNSNNETAGSGASGNWNINGATYIYLAIA